MPEFVSGGDDLHVVSCAAHRQSILVGDNAPFAANLHAASAMIDTTGKLAAERRRGNRFKLKRGSSELTQRGDDDFDNAFGGAFQLLNRPCW